LNRDEQKRIVREQCAGFALLRRLEVDQMRHASEQDRIRAFRQIIKFASRMRVAELREEDLEVTAAWSKIRAKYRAASR